MNIHSVRLYFLHWNWGWLKVGGQLAGETEEKTFQKDPEKSGDSPLFSIKDRDIIFSSR